MRVRSLFALVVFAVSVVCGTLSAQSTTPTVGAVNVEFTGVKNVSEDVVLANIQVRRGSEYDQNVVDRSIRALYGTGLFDFIEVKALNMENNNVRVVFVVSPKYRVGQIFYEGNEISSTRLAGEVKTEANEVLDELQVDRDATALRDYYLKKGYSNVSVTYDIDRDPQTGYGDITFRINEGDKIKISEVNFKGNDSIKTKTLRKQIETRDRWLLSWMTGSGRFNQKEFSEDLIKLRDYYRNQGFLDVEIPENQVVIEYPSENKMVITITVNEGRRYNVGTITITGNTLFSTEELKSVLRLNSGDVFSPSKLDDDTGALRDYYGQLGYLETRVRADRIPNLETGDIDIRYTVEEGEQVEVETIRIEGNTKTKSIVILRELALAPGDVFDSVKMRASEARLRNTRFFEQVSLTPEPTNIPGRRNLKVNVQEGRTGNLTFGAGFSSLERAVVFFELTQGNFDLFNYRSFFQGDGQKFRLRLQLGSRSNELIIAFEEPWLFERRLAFGAELFRTQTEYLSTVYNESRTGFEVYLRKRLIELWEGRLSYRLEVVDIYDVDTAEASTVIINEEGERTVSKVGFLLLRDTRDNLIFTSKGNRFSFLTEFAGVGGDVEYIRLEARGAQFIPTFEWGNQVLSLVGRAGTLIDYGSDPVPFFDRYYLGGPNTLRGFDYREVGPKDSITGDPIGGNSFVFGSLEYTFEIAEPLRFAVFYDWGVVNSDDNDFDLSDYNDNWGIGLRILLMGAPLRLDYGIPISKDDFNGDDGNQFYFSFGTRF